MSCGSSIPPNDSSPGDTPAVTPVLVLPAPTVPAPPPAPNEDEGPAGEDGGEGGDAEIGDPSANCEKCSACTTTSHVPWFPTVGVVESIDRWFVSQLCVLGSYT